MYLWGEESTWSDEEAEGEERRCCAAGLILFYSGSSLSRVIVDRFSCWMSRYLRFSHQHHHWTPHHPSSRPTPLSPRLFPTLSPCTYPHPHLSTPRHRLNHQPPFFTLLLLLLVGRHYSRPSLPYPVPSSHHLLLRYPPSSPPQGRSPSPPPPLLNPTSLKPGLCNQALQSWPFRRPSPLVPRGSRMKRFG